MASTASDEARIRDVVDRLLADHDPTSTTEESFWGAQFDRGLAWVQFPEGYGGLGVDADLQTVVNDRLQAAGAPSNLMRNFMGVGMAAPTLMAYGSEELRQRHLRQLFTCEEIWCQLFSEPGAGSDLAAIATMARPDGDTWIVNGQKVWTTQAHVARWGLLLARTDPERPKHRGLTYFIIDMEDPGVEVRPLRQLTGEAEFNEVYFTDARIPDTQRLGEVNDGWRVAITTLMNERAALSGLGKQPRETGVIRHAMRTWRSLEDDERDPVRRDELMQLWIEAELIRLTAIRADQKREQGVPGPEGSIGKLVVSELQRDVLGFCTNVRGAAATLVSNYDMTRPTLMSESILGDQPNQDLTKAYLTTLGGTIGGGTTEIGRNILGERVLGLPPEPRLDKDVPWSQVPRS